MRMTHVVVWRNQEWLTWISRKGIGSRARAMLHAAILSLCSTGCVSLPDFPDTWEPVTKASGKECPDISGRYSNIGELYDSKKSVSERLDEYILEGMSSTYPKRPKVTAVELQLLNETALSVRFFEDDRVSHDSLLQREQDFSCSSGELALKAIDDSGVAIIPFIPLPIGHSGSRHRTLTASPNYLIVKYSMRSVGVVGVVPIGEWRYMWIRFPRQK